MPALVSSQSTNSFRSWSLVFWDVASCSHVEGDRRFRGAYCLQYAPLNLRSTPMWLHGTTSQKNELHTRHRKNLKSHIQKLLGFLLHITTAQKNPLSEGIVHYLYLLSLMRTQNRLLNDVKSNRNRQNWEMSLEACCTCNDSHEKLTLLTYHHLSANACDV
jgi:hypothetical protein